MAKPIFLVVKGSAKDAEHAARTRLIDIIIEHETEHEAHCFVPSRFEAKVRAWYNEDNGTTIPLEIGSCLWFKVEAKDQ